MNLFSEVIFSEGYLNGVSIVMLLISLIGFSILDLKTHRVANKYLISLLAALLVLSAASGVDRLMMFLIGLFVGGALFIIPFLIGHVGGADVKIFAISGAVIGYMEIVDAFLYTLILGMIPAVVVLFRNSVRSLSRKCNPVSAGELQNCVTGKDCMQKNMAYIPAITVGVFASILQPLEILL